MGNKKWDEVARVSVRRVPTGAAQLRREVAAGEVFGRKFQVAVGADAALWVDFDRRPDEPEGSLSQDRFVVRIGDVMESIAAVVTGRRPEKLRAVSTHATQPVEGLGGLLPSRDEIVEMDHASAVNVLFEMSKRARPWEWTDEEG